MGKLTLTYTHPITGERVKMQEAHQDKRDPKKICTAPLERREQQATCPTCGAAWDVMTIEETK